MGDRIYGWIGDVIDILSVIVTMFGVCTSLGLGVITLNSGINRMNCDIAENSTNQIIIIWIITMFFDVLQQYGENLEGFLFSLSMATIVLYFVTSSDSGSLVIDCLSANGSPEPPIVQRIFWALTEGAYIRIK
jgi:choline-glycine betaine transporter